MRLETKRALIVDLTGRFDQATSHWLLASGVDEVITVHDLTGLSNALRRRADDLDLIVLLWANASSNGSEVLRHIRRVDCPGFSLPIMVIDEQRIPSREAKALASGATSYLHLSPLPSGLRAAIARTLNDHREFVVCDAYVGPCRRSGRRNPASTPTHAVSLPLSYGLRTAANS